MRPSTHYYVLSLSNDTNALFEAFRDSLIEVENQGFPFPGPTREVSPVAAERRREVARAVDQHFGGYYAQEPLGLVVVGARARQSDFRAVTAHASAVIGRVDGEHSTTSPRDLGKIVWPVVKAEMSGLLKSAMQELALHARQLVTGLESVARFARKGQPATVLVEDGFRHRGGVSTFGESPVITADIDVRDTIDDAVDAVIEMVLEAGGDVVFAPSGSLREWERIVVLPRAL